MVGGPVEWVEPVASCDRTPTAKDDDIGRAESSPVPALDQDELIRDGVWQMLAAEVAAHIDQCAADVVDDAGPPNRRFGRWNGCTADKTSSSAGRPSGTGKTFFLEAPGLLAVEQGLACFTPDDLGGLIRRHRADDTVVKPGSTDPGPELILRLWVLAVGADELPVGRVFR